MIASWKKISNSRPVAGSLVKYCLRQSELNPSGSCNFVYAKSVSELAAETDALISLDPGILTPILHFIFSFPDVEKVVVAPRIEEVVAHLVAEMGVSENPYVWGVHTDTDVYHVHLAVLKKKMHDLSSFDSGVITCLFNATLSLCQKFSLTSPFSQYAQFVLAIKMSLSENSWTDAMSVFRTIGLDLWHDDNELMIQSEHWTVPASGFVGHRSLSYHQKRLGPYPSIMPCSPHSKPQASKPSFWVVRKAALLRIAENHRQYQDDFETRIHRANVRCSRAMDDELVLAQMELEVLLAGLEALSLLFREQRRIIMAIRYADWEFNSEIIEEALINLLSKPTFSIKDMEILKKIPSVEKIYENLSKKHKDNFEKLKIFKKINI